METILNEFLCVFPIGFGIGFALYVCLSLLGFGIYKALSLIHKI